MLVSSRSRASRTALAMSAFLAVSVRGPTYMGNPNSSSTTRLAGGLAGPRRGGFGREVEGVAIAVGRWTKARTLGTPLIAHACYLLRRGVATSRPTPSRTATWTGLICSKRSNTSPGPVPDVDAGVWPSRPSQSAPVPWPTGTTRPRPRAAHLDAAVANAYGWARSPAWACCARTTALSIRERRVTVNYFLHMSHIGAREGDELSSATLSLHHHDGSARCSTLSDARRHPLPPHGAQRRGVRVRAAIDRLLAKA